MIRCYIGLGSNLLNPMQQILQALEALRDLPQSKLHGCSRFYGSTAIGPGEQDDYVNAVAALDTDLQPQQLLKALQALEAEHGRQRTITWGPRTLDLDLLLYGDLVLDSDELHLPHPRMWERPFVLFPLGELAPQLLEARGLGTFTDAANADPQSLWLLDESHIIRA